MTLGGAGCRSREVRSLRYADNALVRVMGKNEGGEHGTTMVRVMARGVSVERSMSRRASQGTDVAEPTLSVRSERVARDFDATLARSCWRMDVIVFVAN